MCRVVCVVCCGGTDGARTTANVLRVKFGRIEWC